MGEDKEKDRQMSIIVASFRANAEIWENNFRKYQKNTEPETILNKANMEKLNSFVKDYVIGLREIADLVEKIDNNSMLILLMIVGMAFVKGPEGINELIENLSSHLAKKGMMKPKESEEDQQIMEFLRRTEVGGNA